MNTYFASALLAVSAMAAAGTDYTEMGENWSKQEAHPEWKVCETGREQSPIDLSTTGATISDTMEVRGVNYYDLNVLELNTDLISSGNTSVKFDFFGYDKKAKFDTAKSSTAADLMAQAMDAELQLTFNDGSQSFFTPLQFHFHSPSEHTVDGKSYDLEVHFVHIVKGSVNSEGVPLLGAVIGVFFDVDEGKDTENTFLTQIQKTYAQGELFKNRNTVTNEYSDRASDTYKRESIGIRAFLAGVNMGDYWSYEGSLTTPPCTEGIKWSVMKQVQSMSQAQLDDIKMQMLLPTTEAIAADAEGVLAAGNARKTQQLNARTLYYSGAGSLVAGTAAAMAAIAALSF